MCVLLSSVRLNNRYLYILKVTQRKFVEFTIPVTTQKVENTFTLLNSLHSRYNDDYLQLKQLIIFGTDIPQ